MNAPLRIPGSAHVPANNLRRLMLLRTTAIGGLALVVGMTQWLLGLGIPLGLPLSILAVMALDNLDAWRLTRRAAPVTRTRFLRHLLVDIAGLTAVLYVTGGHANPFASLYLLPLAVAASTLPARDTGTLALASVACYTALMFWNVPLPHPAGMAHDNFSLHLVGMWGSFVLAAGVMAFFVAAMADELREREEGLARAREAALRDQQVVALGALAAGAAHELGTPLSTMTLLVDELRERCPAEADVQDDLDLLKSQVLRCRENLTRILAAGGELRGEGASAGPVDRLIAQALARFAALRPDHVVHQKWGKPAPGPKLVIEETLIQSLVSLFNNAADASPRPIDLAIDWDALWLHLSIHDEGAGVSPELAPRLGQMGASDKAGGHGLGLFLAQSVIQRMGGKMTLEFAQGRGSCARITLPLLSRNAVRETEDATPESFRTQPAAGR
jgi:two-component system sensor histidine kinase RegB